MPKIQLYGNQLGVVANSCNPSDWEAGVGEWFEDGVTVCGCPMSIGCPH
ncbi:MAG: hypothetical protein GY938_18660 [Ketobacter sp.]|nr:hypothetical protein [Ketobacter sp.]